MTKSHEQALLVQNWFFMYMHINMGRSISLVMKQGLWNFTQTKGLWAQVTGFMEFLIFRSWRPLSRTSFLKWGRGCDFTESYRVSPHGIKILILCFQCLSFIKKYFQGTISCTVSKICRFTRNPTINLFKKEKRKKKNKFILTWIYSH